MTKFEIPTEAARPLYAGVGATDLVIGYVRDVVGGLQKRLVDVQKDVETRISGLDLQPHALRDQATVVVASGVDALSKDAKARRAAIEARVAELHADANATYAELAKRGETLVERIRKQESTQATVTSARITSAKARTTTTQATKATRSTTATAKKSAPAPKSSAKATATAAKKTTRSSAAAATDAAAKVGD